jgi:hypothetical protein
MQVEDVAHFLDSLIEDLAAKEHRRWSDWQRYVHSNACRQPDGSLLIPAALVRRWEKQIATNYQDLDDREKESDREQVRKYLPVIAAALRKRLVPH